MKKIVALTEKDEKKALDAQSEKVKKDRAYGIEVAKRAGILDKNGQLSGYYKPKS